MKRTEVASPYMSVREAARYLRMSYSTMNDLVKLGFIPYLDLGVRTVSAHDVDAFFDRWKSRDIKAAIEKKKHPQKVIKLDDGEKRIPIEGD